MKSHHDAMRVTLNSWGVHNLTTKKDYYYIQEKVLLKMGEQDGDKIFCFDINDPNLEARLMAVIDYISGMTDIYALDVYQKINGISLPIV